MNYMEEYKRWLSLANADADVAAELRAMDEVKIEDAFYRNLAFGTGGLRGTIGAGTNRMNVHTVAKASQGLADYLVKKGMPFRSAYKISGQIVAKCIAEGLVLETLPLESYRQFSDLFENDLYQDIDLNTCVEKRISQGGTSQASVDAQIAYVKDQI